MKTSTKTPKTIRGILTDSYLHEMQPQQSSGRMRWFVIRSKRLDDGVAMANG